MKVVFASMLIGACFLSACSDRLRQSHVPSVVQNTIAQQFANANDVEWEKEKQDYEAEFVRDSVEYKAIVNPAGSLVKYKQELNAAQLPAAIMQTIQAQYKDYVIDGVEKIAQGDQVYYQVELENKLKEMNLVFRADGAIDTNIKYWD